MPDQSSISFNIVMLTRNFLSLRNVLGCLVSHCIFVAEAEPARLNYYNYVADDVAPPTELVSQKSQADDDPSSKREER